MSAAEDQARELSTARLERVRASLIAALASSPRPSDQAWRPAYLARLRAVERELRLRAAAPVSARLT